MKSSRVMLAVGGQAKENMGGEEQEKSGEGGGFLGRELLDWEGWREELEVGRRSSVAEGKAALEQDAQERFGGGSASKKEDSKSQKKGWGGIKVADERGRRISRKR